MKLIIINGLPATGKTTIAKPLSATLGIPLISKDTIKEFLFDNLGIKDREWSRTLGKASNDFLYELAETLLANNKSIMIENAFEKSFAMHRLQNLIDKYKPDVFELYCSTDKETRRRRFNSRNESGERHKGHVDNSNYLADSDPEPYKKYAPLKVGKVIHVDTTNSNNINIGELIEIINPRN